MSKRGERREVKNVADNRKARHDYHIVETYEAGIALLGSEVKSLRMGRVSLRDSYAMVENGEVILYNMHVAPYEKAATFGHNPRRPKKLLLHKDEIGRLAGKASAGMSLIPLRIYFKGSWAKVELALAKSKRLYDKRRAIAERDARRQIERELKARGE